MIFAKDGAGKGRLILWIGGRAAVGGLEIRAWDIFLSYAREDAPIAQRLASALEDEG